MGHFRGNGPQGFEFFVLHQGLFQQDPFGDVQNNAVHEFAFAGRQPGRAGHAADDGMDRVSFFVAQAALEGEPFVAGRAFLEYPPGLLPVFRVDYVQKPVRAFHGFVGTVSEHGIACTVDEFQVEAERVQGKNDDGNVLHQVVVLQLGLEGQVLQAEAFPVAAHGHGHFVPAEGLGKIIVCADANGFHRVFENALSGYEDDAGLRGALFDFPRQTQAAAFLNADIHHGQGEPLLAQGRKSLAHLVIYRRGKAVFYQNRLKQGTVVRIGCDHQCFCLALGCFPIHIVRFHQAPGCRGIRLHPIFSLNQSFFNAKTRQHGDGLSSCRRKDADGCRRGSCATDVYPFPRTYGKRLGASFRAVVRREESRRIIFPASRLSRRQVGWSKTRCAAGGLPDLFAGVP